VSIGDGTASVDTAVIFGARDVQFGLALVESSKGMPIVARIDSFSVTADSTEYASDSFECPSVILP
jgi:hypothetical protein